MATRERPESDHGSTEEAAKRVAWLNGGQPKIEGFCPMGCGETLYLGPGSYINCSSPDCLRSSAVAEILADSETGHIVELGEDSFQLLHPLRERLDDSLFECTLHEFISAGDGPPAEPGRYRVTPVDGGEWHFEAVAS